jgi:hypothetical protein
MATLNKETTVQSKEKNIRHATAVAVTLALTWSSGSSFAVTAQHDFVNAGIVFGSSNANTLTGSESLNTTSNNFMNFTNNTLDYVYGAAAAPGTVASGTWSWSNGGDSLTGTFATLAVEQNFAATPFWRYTGTRTVTGGTGYFAGATGSGTAELFIHWTGVDGNGTQFYQGIDVTRLSVTVETDAPLAQTDTRPVIVMAKNGVENLVTGVGYNEGPYTSASPGLELAIHERADYTFAPLPIATAPFAGTWEATYTNGTIFGTSEGPTISYNHLGSVFHYAPGSAKQTGGTGAFVGASASSTYEAFAVSTGGPQDAATYSQIVVTRVNPVPEPASVALMLAGGGVLAAWSTRRRRRSSVVR